MSTSYSLPFAPEVTCADGCDCQSCHVWINAPVAPVGSERVATWHGQESQIQVGHQGHKCLLAAVGVSLT
jgi:hypothetical protein